MADQAEPKFTKEQYAIFDQLPDSEKAKHNWNAHEYLKTLPLTPGKDAAPATTPAAPTGKSPAASTPVVPGPSRSPEQEKNDKVIEDRLKNGNAGVDTVNRYDQSRSQSDGSYEVRSNGQAYRNPNYVPTPDKHYATDGKTLVTGNEPQGIDKFYSMQKDTSLKDSLTAGPRDLSGRPVNRSAQPPEVNPPASGLSAGIPQVNNPYAIPKGTAKNPWVQSDYAGTNVQAPGETNDEFLSRQNQQNKDRIYTPVGADGKPTAYSKDPITAGLQKKVQEELWYKQHPDQAPGVLQPGESKDIIIANDGSVFGQQNAGNQGRVRQPFAEEQGVRTKESVANSHIEKRLLTRYGGGEWTKTGGVDSSNSTMTPENQKMYDAELAANKAITRNIRLEETNAIAQGLLDNGANEFNVSQIPVTAPLVKDKVTTYGEGYEGPKVDAATGLGVSADGQNVTLGQYDPKTRTIAQTGFGKTFRKGKNDPLGNPQTVDKSQNTFKHENWHDRFAQHPEIIPDIPESELKDFVSNNPGYIGYSVDALKQEVAVRDPDRMREVADTYAGLKDKAGNPLYPEYAQARIEQLKKEAEAKTAAEVKQQEDIIAAALKNPGPARSGYNLPQTRGY